MPLKRKESSITSVIDLVFLTLFGLLALNPRFHASEDRKPEPTLVQTAAQGQGLDIEAPQDIVLTQAGEIWVESQNRRIPLQKLADAGWQVTPHVQLIFSDVPARSIAECLHILRQTYHIQTLDLKWCEPSATPK